jgi:group I intron endonuclease
MQRAWNKYGENAFEFVLLIGCSLDSLYEQEQKYIDQLKPVYNVTGKALGGQVGIKRSDSFKQHLSERTKGNKWNIGRKHSDEMREKVSRSLIGNKRNLGRKLTLEQVRNLRSILTQQN